jgi:muramidase (phage lysozyme)
MNQALQPLLQFIRQHEARGDYNIVWGGIRKADHPRRKLTSMTVKEVLDWQDSIDRAYGSEAAGAYQIMEDTLRPMVNSGKVKASDLFDEKTQDALAAVLLEGRGLNDFLADKISPVVFGQSLSKEWASLPCTLIDKRGRPAQGQSYYDGDGLNKSGAKVTEFVQLLAKLREAIAVQSTLPSSPASAATTSSVLQRFLSYLLGKKD